MATYGYAGDFSSDDDEKVDQAQAPTMYDDQNRLSKAKIEEYIEKIKKLPYDEDITLTHDALAGILDYYKIQRGPIVDSTRKLYTKIALRLARGEIGKESSGPDVPVKELNGNSNNNNNNNDNNTSQQTSADAFSSDDEDIEITGVKNGVKNFDLRAVHNNNNLVENDDDDQMEVDSEDHHKSRAPRNSKPIDLVTTEDEDDSTTSDDSESDDDGSNNESREPKVTPIKPLPSATREKEAIEVLLAMHPSTPKPTESASLRRQPLAHSTPKESASDTAKKPYTRSQRVTRSTTKGVRDMKKLESSSSSADVFIEKKQDVRKSYAPVVLALVVLALGFLAFYFRSNILSTTEPLFRKKLTF